MKDVPKKLGHESNSKLAVGATTALLAQASKIAHPTMHLRKMTLKCWGMVPVSMWDVVLLKQQTPW